MVLMAPAEGHARLHARGGSLFAWQSGGYCRAGHPIRLGFMGRHVIEVRKR